MRDRETLEWENGKARVYREGRDGTEARDATPLEVEQYRQNEQLHELLKAEALYEQGRNANNVRMYSEELEKRTAEVERLKADLESLETSLTTEMAKTIKRQGDRVQDLKAEVERLKASMLEHFQREHLGGDGPEIDRWKAHIDAALALHVGTERIGLGLGCSCGWNWENGQCQSPTVKALKGQP